MCTITPSCIYFIKIATTFKWFLFIKLTIDFFELFLDTPARWHISISFGDISALIWFKISSNHSSKFWSETLSWIPVISMLLKRPYCSSELCSLSRAKILFSRTFKSKITGNTSNNGNLNDVEIIVALNYLSNFWRTLGMPLINCEANLILT